jgi:hypothetical protein
VEKIEFAVFNYSPKNQTQMATRRETHEWKQLNNGAEIMSVVAVTGWVWDTIDPATIADALEGKLNIPPDTWFEFYRLPNGRKMLVMRSNYHD